MPTPDFNELYRQFDSPVTALDCGHECAPYNPTRKPFCCDICTAVPAVYHKEWTYLRKNTDLWKPWLGSECPDSAGDLEKLTAQTPGHMRLVECLGPQACQRGYRSMSCRQFPFFPYITSDDCFIGLAYNWDFEPYCWVISNLDRVTRTFREEFVEVYDRLLYEIPHDYESYADLSDEMRAEFTRQGRQIAILHRDGSDYWLDPQSETLQKITADQFGKFGPYCISGPQAGSA